MSKIQSQQSQVDKNTTKQFSDEDLKTLYRGLQDDDSRVSMNQLRSKIEQLGLSNKCKIFMKKTDNMEEDNQLRKDELKYRLQINYNNEKDFQHIFGVLAEAGQKLESSEIGGKTDKIKESQMKSKLDKKQELTITSSTLEELNKLYKLDLKEEDIKMMIKHAGKDSADLSVSCAQLNEFFVNN